MFGQMVTGIIDMETTIEVDGLRVITTGNRSTTLWHQFKVRSASKDRAVWNAATKYKTVGKKNWAEAQNAKGCASGQKGKGYNGGRGDVKAEKDLLELDLRQNIRERIRRMGWSKARDALEKQGCHSISEWMEEGKEKDV